MSARVHAMPRPCNNSRPDASTDGYRYFDSLDRLMLVGQCVGFLGPGARLCRADVRGCSGQRGQQAAESAPAAVQLWL